jgi:hypothetical protein
MVKISSEVILQFRVLVSSPNILVVFRRNFALTFSQTQNPIAKILLAAISYQCRPRLPECSEIIAYPLRHDIEIHRVLREEIRRRNDLAG